MGRYDLMENRHRSYVSLTAGAGQLRTARRRPLALIGVGLLTVCLGAALIPESASADVRTRQIPVTYPAPAPSLSPDPAADPANQILLRWYSVSYDADAGTITYVGGFNGDPVQARSWMPDLELSCDEAERPLSLRAGDHSPGQTGSWASSVLKGFEGHVEGAQSVAADTVTYTFSHSEFRGRGYECFYEDGIAQYFTGYSPQEKAERQPTQVTVGPYRYSDRRLLDDRPSRFGLWGQSNAGSGRFLKVRWSVWERNHARGSGLAEALHGENKRGRLVFQKYKVRFTLNRTRLCGEFYEFTRVRITSRYGGRTMKIPGAC